MRSRGAEAWDDGIPAVEWEPQPVRDRHLVLSDLGHFQGASPLDILAFGGLESGEGR